MKSNMNLSGDVTFTILDSQGVVNRVTHKNRVTQKGVELIMNRFIACAGPFITSMAVGLDNTPPNGLEIGLGAVASSALLKSYQTTLSPPVGGAIEFQCTFPQFADVTAINEIGMFAGDTLFSRSIFPTITMEPSQYLDIAWVISFTSV